jgi:hypothetical protein
MRAAALLAGALLAAAATSAAAGTPAVPADMISIVNDTKTTVRCMLKSGDEVLSPIVLEGGGSFLGQYRAGAIYVLDCPKLASPPFGPVAVGSRYALINRGGKPTLALINDAPKK